MKPEAPTTHIYLDLSTSVIPNQERDLLESAPVRVIVHEYGAWVHVPPLEYDNDELDPSTHPAWQNFPALLRVLTAARDLDADWVNLDADAADVFPHLPAFDRQAATCSGGDAGRDR